jgi:hypothetical protein
VNSGRSSRHGGRTPQSEGPAMADIGLIVLTILLFGLPALAVKGIERL